VTADLEALVDSLLWEGYALYPYTPGATKNATPTPFGIVYPPAYAETLASTYDHLELRCELRARADAVLEAELRFLAAGAERHEAGARTLSLPGAMVGALAVNAAEKEALVEPEHGPPLIVGLALRAVELGPGRYEVSLRVENRTVVSTGLHRGGALARSLLSTHPLLRVTGGRFVSPLERPYDSVNTFPVLATPDDDAVLGAAIVLPDHPQIAPESRGGLFDSTEIEEALLLHVQVLSDEERAEIEAADPKVREMVARAETTTPEEIVALHGRVTLRDPREGEAEATVAGRTFRRGGKVMIRPPEDADIQARMLDGRIATIEKIFTDYDGKTHLGVTIDDDPGQDLMRETGRFLYFFAPEVEVL
jgi:hypothetical protein